MSSASDLNHEHALTIDRLTRRFGGITAVDSVSMVVRPGEVVAMVGPNGAGKSTVLQLISALLAPDSGSVHLGTDQLTGRTPEEIAALGVARAFQTSRVFPVLSVWDSVRVAGIPALIGGGRFGHRIPAFLELAAVLFGTRRHRARVAELDRRTAEVLELFGERLLPRRDDTAQSLSYANRRRLELARALVADPYVLLLDEPTAGMNPTETEELVRLLQVLHHRRPELAILVVEHKMNVVRALADRAVVMDHGSVIAEGPPQEVLQNELVIEAYLGRKALHSEAAREAIAAMDDGVAAGEAGGHTQVRGALQQ